MQWFNLEKIWRLGSATLLDIMTSSQRLRNWIVEQGEKKLYQTIVVENPDNRPQKLQEMRFMALRNLLRNVGWAIADGRLSCKVRRSLIHNFFGQVVMGESNRLRPYKERHGYEPPSFLVISPSKRCNLHCTGCYAGSTSKNAETLRYSVLQRLMREKTEDWGSHFTVISGGEPLMYASEGKSVFDLLGDNPDNYFMMYTNSTLITRDVAKRMAELGNVTPAISVEGWEKQTDMRRGKGVFLKILKAMENLRSEGVPFGISATATRKNAEIILSDEFIKFFFNRQGALYGWIFQYMPIGRSYTIDLMVTPEQRLRMVKRELELLNETEYFLIDFWNSGPLAVGCFAAGRPGGYFYVDWNGNLSPCAFYPYYIDNLYEIYRKNLNLTAVLESKFFTMIRAWQDSYAYRSTPEHMKNVFMPCSIRDHYKVAYETIKKCAARPLDENAEKAIADSEYRKRMIKYDKCLSELLDPVWEQEILAYERPGYEAAIQGCGKVAVGGATGQH